MPADFYIKQNDTLPLMKYTVVDSNNVPVDLSGATRVRLRIKQNRLTDPVLLPTTFENNGQDGKIKINFSAHTVIVGQFAAEVLVNTGAAVQTYPAHGTLVIEVAPRLL